MCVWFNLSVVAFEFSFILVLEGDFFLYSDVGR